MSHDKPRILLVVLLLSGLVALIAAVLSPQYFADYYYLGTVIFVEAMILAAWDYAARFFPVLLGVFLLAGIDVPLGDVWSRGRWYVLAIAALVGFAIFLRERNQHFLPFHVIALFCVVAALISGFVSSYPRVATLKALSLLLLFTYTTTGARLAVLGREAKFCAALLTAVEFLSYAAAACYFIFHYEFFGNPNSLGAVAGVAGMPLLLWGVLVTQVPRVRRRRMVGLVLMLLLLLYSHSRAGIAGAVVSCSLLCLSLRNYRLLLKGALLTLMAAILVTVAAPSRADHSGSLLEEFVYKGDEQGALLASRRSVWDETATAIRQHPWFGSGFGTVATSYDSNGSQGLATASTAKATKEHGSSYLAIVDWVGLLGVVPFFGLVLVTSLNAGRVMLWLRRNQDPLSPAVPFAAVLIAGLVHAGFEDWLFAVGYYLCPFFWSLAFVLADVLPASRPVLAPDDPSYGFAPPADFGFPVPEP